MFQHFFLASTFEKKKNAIPELAKTPIQALGFNLMTKFPDVFPKTKPIELLPLYHINHEINIIDKEVHWRMKPQRFKPHKAFMKQLQERIACELKTG